MCLRRNEATMCGNEKHILWFADKILDVEFRGYRLHLSAFRSRRHGNKLKCVV